MKVLLLVPDSKSVGGVSNYYNTLQLEEICSGIEYLPVNCAEAESPFRIALRLLSNYRALWRKLSSGGYSLVVVNPSFNPRSFFRDAIFCRIALHFRLPVLVFFRGWSSRFEGQVRRSALLRTFFRRTFGRVTDFVVLGTVFREKLIQLGCRSDSYFHIETTVADDRGLQTSDVAARSQQQQFRVLFLSRLIAGKGVRTAIDAFVLAKRQCAIPMELVVAGDGPELSVMQAYAHGMDSVHFCGPVSGEAKANLLRSSQMLLFPSHDEGMPNVILEAMLYGMPVLTTPVGSIPEVVEHGVNGYIAEPGDVHAFATWLVRLAEDKDLCEQMASVNRDKASKLYARSKVRLRLIEIFQKTLRKHAAEA